CGAHWDPGYNLWAGWRAPIPKYRAGPLSRREYRTVRTHASLFGPPHWPGNRTDCSVFALVAVDMFVSLGFFRLGLLPLGFGAPKFNAIGLGRRVLLDARLGFPGFGEGE